METYCTYTWKVLQTARRWVVELIRRTNATFNPFCWSVRRVEISTGATQSEIQLYSRHSLLIPDVLHAACVVQREFLSPNAHFVET